MLFSRKPKAGDLELSNSYTEFTEQTPQQEFTSETKRSITDKTAKYNKERLENAYRNSPLLRKICDKPATDATSKWRKWNADKEVTEQLQAEEKRLNVRSLFAEGFQISRQEGGSFLVVHVAGQSLADPLDYDTITQGSITHLQPLRRDELDSVDFEADFGNPNHGKPSMYNVSTNATRADGSSIMNSSTPVHPSRMIVFRGERGHDASNSIDSYLGDPFIQSLIKSIKHWESFHNNVAVAGFKFANPILYMTNVLKKAIEQDKLAEGTGAPTAAKLWNMITRVLGITGTMILDKDNARMEILPYNFAGCDPIMFRLLKKIAADCGIPLTILSGEHQPGLGSSGSGDIVNYNTMIRGLQQDKVEPPLNHLDRALIMSAIGSNPDDLSWIWNELSETTALDMASLFRIEAQEIREQVAARLISEVDGEKIIAKLLLESGLSAS